MGRSITAIAVLLAVATPQVAFALKAEEMMSDWRHASKAERSALLDAFQAKTHATGHVTRPDVLNCMDRAANTEGHGALPIAEMVQACSELLAPSGTEI